MKNRLVIICLILYTFSFAQKKERLLNNVNIGFNYGVGHEDNVLFNDPDYSYDVHFYKVQLYYPLKKKNHHYYEILVQPEINTAQHQLHNLYYVTPDEPNYLEKRALFTTQRTFKEYILNIGFLVRRPLLKHTDAYAFLSVGPSIIDSASERLAKGFAFSDNLAFGLQYTVTNHIVFDVRSVIRHVSNASTQQPNGGYNTLNFEIGFVYKP